MRRQIGSTLYADLLAPKSDRQQKGISEMLRSAAKTLFMRLPAVSRLVQRRDSLLEEVAHLRQQLASAKTAGDPHFVTEYTELVKWLIATYPIDEAMSLAVGGDYDRLGKLAAEVVQSCGLREGHSLVDLGCGSVRLAKQIGIAFPNIKYTGIDIVQELLDYASSKSPAHFRFILNRTINIPCTDSSVDFVIAFSVFTHLYHDESYAYLRDIRRALHPGGKVIFSFLESNEHWPVFEKMLAN